MGERSGPERGAVALLLPAGAAGYVFGIVTRQDYGGFSIWLPSIVAGFLVLGVLYAARFQAGEPLGAAAVVGLVAMHVLCGAVVATLIAGALPSITGLPNMLPILEWTRPPMLALFAATDLVTLLLLRRQEARAAER